MTVSRIDDDDVDTGLHQCRDAVIGVSTGAHRSPGSELAALILAGVGIGLGLGDVLDGHHALQLELVVDEQHLLDAVAVQEFGDGLDRRVLRRGHKTLPRRHDVGHSGVHAGLEPDVAAGDDAEQIRAPNHRYSGDLVLQGEGHEFADRGFRANGDGVADHPGLELLDRPDFPGLGFHGQVLVDVADAAFLGQGDGESGLRYGVHRGGDQRDIEVDSARQAGAEIDFGGEGLGVGRHKEDVIECQSFVNNPQHWSTLAKRGGGSYARPWGV